MFKRKFICWALCTLLLSLTGIGGFAQENQPALPKTEAINWKQVGTYTTVLGFFDTGTSLLMSAGSKIQRSTDNGNTWVESNTGNTINAPTGFAMMGTKIFVIGSNQVYASTDDGQTWSKVSDLIGGLSLSVYNNTLYATTSAAFPAGGRVYRSTDEGKTWTQLFQVGTNTSAGMNSFAAVDGALVASSDFSGVYRSADNGATWTQVKIGSCTGVAASGNTLYASLGDGVYRSRDKGVNWVRTNIASFTAGTKPALNGSQIFVRNATFPDEIRYSPNEGYYWVTLPAPANFMSQILVKSGVILVGTSLGSVYAGTQLDTLPTAPSGALWSFNGTIPTGIDYTNFRHFTSVGNTLFVIGANKLYRSNDFGLSWQDKTLPVNTNADAPQQISAGSKYLFLTNGNGVYRSADNGNTWQVANTGLPANGVNTWIVAKGETVFFYSSNAMYRSLDSGASWTAYPVSPTATFTTPDGLLVIGDSLLVFERGGTIKKSTDNGATWTTITTSGLPVLSVTINQPSYSNYATDGTIIFMTVRSTKSATDAGIYRSSDIGKTWTKVSSLLPGSAQILMTKHLFYDGQNLLLPGTPDNSNNDIQLSTNAGQTFTALKANVDNTFQNQVLGMTTIGSKILAVTYGGNVLVGTGFITTTQTTVSAATYAGDSATAEGIASAFGNGMTLTTESATAIPLPTTLGEIQVKVKDSAGVERLAGLFYVSPAQVNYQIPAGTAPGTAMVTVISTASNNAVAMGNVSISTVAPGLFTSNMDGTGVPSALVQRFSAGGAMAYEAIGAKDGTGKYAPTPIDLGPTTDQVYLGLFGTGVRGRSDLSKVSVSIGGQSVPVSYASGQGYFVGLDQINVLIPRTLIGKGETDLVLTVDGKAANTVRVNIK